MTFRLNDGLPGEREEYFSMLEAKKKCDLDLFWRIDLSLIFKEVLQSDLIVTFLDIDFEMEIIMQIVYSRHQERAEQEG